MRANARSNPSKEKIYMTLLLTLLTLICSAQQSFKWYDSVQERAHVETSYWTASVQKVEPLLPFGYEPSRHYHFGNITNAFFGCSNLWLYVNSCITNDIQMFATNTTPQITITNYITITNHATFVKGKHHD